MITLIACSVCGRKVENDNVQGLKYKRKNYCIDCFCDNFKQVEVDKHFAYLRFQDVAGRVPTAQEWTQMERLIKEHDWDWYKIEKMLEYVYQVECKEISEDYGIIGILPFYETQARKFFNTVDRVLDSLTNEESFEEDVVVFATQYKRKPGKIEFKSIDRLINWEEEDDE